MQQINILQRIATLSLFACTLAFYSDGASARSNKVILYYDSGNVVTRLDRISPLSDGLRAILAMYALQNGTGCVRSEAYQCVLTDALEIGGQCSDTHLKLVQAWFKSGIPNMSWYSSINPESIDDMRNSCYQKPDGASFQRLWNLIQVEVTEPRVRVYGSGMWLARDSSGEFRFDTEYEIGPNTIKVISHRDISKKDRK